MAETLDVYRDWLKIESPERPPNYYQLLHLDKFEDDVDRIRRRYRKLNEHARKYASGKYAKQSQKLLNELARAMLCLTDERRKNEYDASLGRREQKDGQRESVEQILLRRKLVDQRQIAKARDLAAAIGIDIQEALKQQKAAPTEAIMQAYADSLGIPFLDLSDITIDEELIPKVSAVLARKHSLAPVMADGDEVLLVSPQPINMGIEEDLRMRLGRELRTVLCTPADINRLIAEYYPQSAVAAETSANVVAEPEETEPKPPPEGMLGKISHWIKTGGKG